MLWDRSVAVCMERLQDLDGKQDWVLNEQILYLFLEKGELQCNEPRYHWITPVLQ